MHSLVLSLATKYDTVIHRTKPIKLESSFSYQTFKISIPTLQSSRKYSADIYGVLFLVFSSHEKPDK